MKSRRDLSFQRDPRSAQQDQHRPDQAVSFSQETEALRDWASPTSRIRLPTATGHLPALASAFASGSHSPLSLQSALRPTAQIARQQCDFAEARRIERSTFFAQLTDAVNDLRLT